MGTITTVEQLREAYPAPLERAVRKTLTRLDGHMRRFIALSPFVCLGTAGESGADVTPRGDTPGFVHVLDDTTLLVPDWPGNNRLDSLTNLVTNPQVGLLFLIPGVGETLRVNGTAEIRTDPELRERWTVNGKHPRTVLRVTVQEAYLHCAKAFIRSRLWSDEARIDRSALPSYAQMMKDQGATDSPLQEVEAAIDQNYKTGLY